MPTTMISFSNELVRWFGQVGSKVYGGWLYGMACLGNEQAASDRWDAFRCGYRAGGSDGDYLLRSILEAYKSIHEKKPDSEQRVETVRNLFKLRKRVEFEVRSPYTFQQLERVLVQIEGSRGLEPCTLLMTEDFVTVLGLVMRRV